MRNRAPSRVADSVMKQGFILILSFNGFMTAQFIRNDVMHFLGCCMQCNIRIFVPLFPRQAWWSPGEFISASLPPKESCFLVIICDDYGSTFPQVGSCAWMSVV